MADRRECHPADYPTLFMDFSPARTDENGLLCRDGDGGISTTTYLPAGGGNIDSASAQTCGYVFDGATWLTENLCHALNRGNSLFALPLTSFKNSTFTISLDAAANIDTDPGVNLGASFGTEVSPARQWESMQAAAANRAASEAYLDQACLPTT